MLQGITFREFNVTVTIYSSHPVLLSRLLAAIQQAHTELPEDGTWKH
jgi:hypothetical protein